MSIKPENKALYPTNWKEISKETIIKRGEFCEHCGATRIYLKENQKWLTVHHKDRNPANNNPKNLIILCPKCHFRAEYEINFGISNKNQLALDL